MIFGFRLFITPLPYHFTWFSATAIRHGASTAGCSAGGDSPFLVPDHFAYHK